MNIARKWFPTAGARRYDLGHDGLMHAIEGRRGRGKSYAMARLVLLMAAQRTPVVTNVGSLDFYRMALWLARNKKFANLYDALTWFHANVTIAKTWDDVLGAYDSVVIFDEATRLFDARRSLSVQAPSILFEWFKQSRKVRCTTYFVAHAIGWLDVRIQENLDLVWLVRKESDKKKKAPDGTQAPVRFRMYGLNPGGVGKVKEMERDHADVMTSFPFRVEVARMYHSWELVQEIVGTPSWNLMDEIKRHHVSKGRNLGLDGVELLERDLQRLRQVSDRGDDRVTEGQVGRMMRNRPAYWESQGWHVGA
jgi:hypothetical protein